MIKNINNVQKKLFLIFSDLIIICLSVYLSYSIRLEKFYNIFEIDIKIFLIFLSVFFTIFYFQNIYQILIRYFDYYSVIKIFKSILLSFIILVPINFTLYEYIYFPRSISFMNHILLWNEEWWNFTNLLKRSINFNQTFDRMLDLTVIDHQSNDRSNVRLFNWVFDRTNTTEGTHTYTYLAYCSARQ